MQNCSSHLLYLYSDRYTRQRNRQYRGARERCACGTEREDGTRIRVRHELRTYVTNHAKFAGQQGKMLPETSLINVLLLYDAKT